VVCDASVGSPEWQAHRRVEHFLTLYAPGASPRHPTNTARQDSRVADLEGVRIHHGRAYSGRSRRDHCEVGRGRPCRSVDHLHFPRPDSPPHHQTEDRSHLTTTVRTLLFKTESSETEHKCDSAGECKEYMVKYLDCLKTNGSASTPCRVLGKDYLDCRMNRYAWVEA
jgi:hypothetical protein